ncbi:MAG: prenyltransferase/squalene oxidase repeat-containing protein [Actinocatenispora sp.]
MDLDAAARYVRTFGGPTEIARLDRLLTGARPEPSVVDELVGGAHSGGGWPTTWSPGAPTVEGTCLRLNQLAAFGLLDCAPARLAVRWLVAGQLPDGRWQEDSALGDAVPSWLRPDDPAANWYLTASAGLCVAVAAGDGRAPDAAVRAARLVGGEVSEAGTLPSFLVTHWLAAGLCWRCGDRATADRLLDRIRWPDDTLSPADWAWCGWVLGTAGVPVEHPASAAVREALRPTQRPDGSWPGHDGPDQDVLVTLTALATLRAAMDPAV